MLKGQCLLGLLFTYSVGIVLQISIILPKTIITLYRTIDRMHLDSSRPLHRILPHLSTNKANLHEDSFVNLLGIDENSWGLSHKGLIWHNGRWTYYTRPFRENVSTRIGVLFDGIAGTLIYYKDGKCLGIAFKGLNEIKEPLYPVVCSTAAKTEMVLENMRRDFVNLQDRCRAVIIKRIRHKQDIKKLYLPSRIQSYLAEVMEDTIEPFKLVNQNINFLESNFLTTIPSKD